LGQGENSYNSVDASLWFFWSLGQYLKATKDLKGVEKHLLPAMIDILETFSSGKAPHVSVDPTTGLLWAGSVHTQLTWMDAQVFGKPVTPRYGLAVEINALYHYGLELTIDIAKKVKATVPAHFASEKKKIEKYFEEVFVHPTHGGLCDVINEHGQDSKIRPNQVFALSLSQKLLSDKTRKKVLALVESDLLTPYGLRTLSPADPAYRSHYRGDGPARDSAYHQGTVWPWLLGAYVEAALALASEPAVKARELLVYFKPLFEDHLLQVGVGSLSEVFDAQEPYKAGGTPSQAWSVAEAIRAQELIYSHLKKTTKKSSVTLSASKVKTKTSVKTRGPS
jgi:predicted glycogen debranching enzyme